VLALVPFQIPWSSWLIIPINIVQEPKAGVVLKEEKDRIIPKS
jgi:hypothetical protein